MATLAEPDKACLYLFYGPKGQQTSQQILQQICQRFWPGSQQKLKYNAYGKPYLAEQSLFFNISHQQDMIIIGFSRCEIGVDVQFSEPQRNWRRLAKRCASSQELADLKSESDFYQLWVLKEAYFKATGQGLAHHMQHTAFKLAGNNYYEVSQQNKNKSSTTQLIKIHSAHRHWHNYLINITLPSSLSLRQGFAAVCSQHAISDVKCFDIRAQHMI